MSAAVPCGTTALGDSRAFCLCVWVQSPVRPAVDGQLRASWKMLLTETLFSLCNHDNRGSAHPKFLYRSRNHVGISTNWTQGISRILLLRSTTPSIADGTRFYYGNTHRSRTCDGKSGIIIFACRLIIARNIFPKHDLQKACFKMIGVVHTACTGKALPKKL